MGKKNLEKEHTMQKKKFIITLLFAILSIFMITACSDSSNESSNSVNNGGGGTVQPEPEPDNLTVKKFYNFDAYYSFSAYALLSDGSLYTWGDNKYGQLGLGDKANRYYYPSENQKINIPDKINELIGLKDTGYDTSERTTFYKFSLYAITENGELYAWGDNSNGQLGIGNTDNQTKPVKVTGITGKIKQLITFQHYGKAFFDYFYVYAITEDGSLYAWGYNGEGLLGVGDKMDRNTPIKINLPGKIKELIKYNSSVYTILEDGSLYAWNNNTPTPTKINLPGKVINLIGNGNYAILEDGSLYSSLSINSTPTKVNLPGKVINLIGQFAILEDGSLYAWGNNDSGQLGIGSENYYVDTPTKVNLPGKVKEVKQSAFSSSTYVLLEDGTLYTCGSNYYGQLGLGSDEKKVSIPTKVDLPDTIKELITNGYSVYAILEDGSLYAWGDNRYNGELGVGSENDYVNTPTKVNLPGKIKELIIYGLSIYAILEDNSLYAWGYNGIGLLGVGSENVTVNTPNKVNLPGTIKELTTNVNSVYAILGNSVYAILEDNSLYAWGYNKNGELGVGKDDNKIYTPEQVTGIDGVIKYINLVQNSSNSDAVVVHFLTEDGLLYGTGLNYSTYPVIIEFKEK